MGKSSQGSSRRWQVVRLGGNGENNKESEETPNTTRQSRLRQGSTSVLHPAPSEASRLVWSGVANAGKEEGEGEERGPRREQGQFCFSSRDLTKLGGGKVCVGLGMKPPMMMRSDQEIPFP